MTGTSPRITTNHGPHRLPVGGSQVPPRPQAVPVTLTLNGLQRTVRVHPMARLLDVLREDLGVKSVKEGCGEGECGACSVRMNGRLVNTCLVPAAQAEGAEILTVEGLARDGELIPLQAAFIAQNGTQCGFCTPGMLMAAEDLLRRCPHPDEDAIRHGLAGNVCRCTGYVKIVDAVQAAAEGAR
jgi:carbon-monoxide dehydrogenase small subunit